MADSKERAGYDQPDNYTQKNATFGVEPPPAYQPPAGMAYGQAGAGYGQPTYTHTTTAVVVNQPQHTLGVVIQPRHPDYMVMSILACLCCFWPTGICAIYYASEANNLARAGDSDGARRMSSNARNLCIASVILGIVCIVVYVVIRVTVLDNQYD